MDQRRIFVSTTGCFRWKFRSSLSRCQLRGDPWQLSQMARATSCKRSGAISWASAWLAASLAASRALRAGRGPCCRARPARPGEPSGLDHKSLLAKHSFSRNGGIVESKVSMPHLFSIEMIRMKWIDRRSFVCVSDNLEVIHWANSYFSQKSQPAYYGLQNSRVKWQW